MFRRTLVSELRPPAHRLNWLCLGQYLTLLTHSNLLLRPRAAFLLHIRTTLSIHVLFYDPSPPPPAPPDRRTSTGCRSSSGRAFIVYVLSTWHSPGVFILITMFAWAPPLTAVALPTTVTELRRF